MAEPRAAIAGLRDAINTVRAACGADPGCRRLLALMSDVEQELTTVSYSGDQPAASGSKLQVALASAKDAVDEMFGDKDDTPASNLKEAASVARQALAARRKGGGNAAYK